MNDDHAVSCYAMAKSLLKGKLTNVKLQNVTLQGCTLSAVSCTGDVCQMHKVLYPFMPPLESSSQVRAKMVAIHHSVCAPRFSWLVTKPLALTILIVCSLLGYATLIIGKSQLETTLRDAPMGALLALAIPVSFYFSFGLHFGEACYAAYHAHVTLKLSWKSSFLWFFAITLVGYPITIEFIDLLRVYRETSTKKS
jgi:hypothetical protein